MQALVPVLLGTPKARLLADNFNSGSLPTDALQTAAGTASIAGGVLQVNTAAAYSRVRSIENYDLTDSDLSVELVQASANSSANSGISVAQEGDSNNQFLIELVSGTASIRFRQVVGGTSADTTITFDPAAHRWWRIRHDRTANTVYWETSPTSAPGTWTTRRSVAAPLQITLGRVELFAGGVTDATPALFDNLNVRPFALLADEFDSALDTTTKWQIPSLLSGGSASTSGGRLRNHFGVPPAGIASRDTHSLVSSEVAIKPFTSAAPKATEGFYLDLIDVHTEGRNRLRFNLIGSTLYARVLLDNVNTGEVSFAYNATDHAWWRIRESGGNVLWDTSPDGITWTNLRTTANPFRLYELSAWLYSNHSGEVQMLRPNADISNPGLWFERPSGSTLAARLSEVTPDDTATEAVRDLRGVTDPTSVAFTVGLSTVLDPFANTGHTVRVRDRRESGVEVVNFNYRLLEGGAERAAWLRTNANSSYNTTEYTLSAAEADAITDYSALRLEITATRVDNVTQTNPVVVVSWAEMQVPYSAVHEIESFNMVPVPPSVRNPIIMLI